MLLKTILPSLAAALTVRAIPQLTTAIPLDVVPDGSGSDDGAVLSGVIIGTGAGGTTYVLTPPVDGPSDIPATATVVENASGLTANIVASSGDLVISQSLGCSFGDDGAVCTQAVVQASGSLTEAGSTIITGAPDIATLVLSTSTPSVPESTSGSDSLPDAPSAPNTSSQPSAANRSTPTAVFVNVVALVFILIVSV